MFTVGVFLFCHQRGIFLSLNVENHMKVQQHCKTYKLKRANALKYCLHSVKVQKAKKITFKAWILIEVIPKIINLIIWVNVVLRNTFNADKFYVYLIVFAMSSAVSVNSELHTLKYIDHH